MAHCLGYLVTNKKPTYEEARNIINKYNIENENRDKTTKFSFDYSILCIDKNLTDYIDVQVGYYKDIKYNLDIANSYLVITETQIYSRDDLNQKDYEIIVNKLDLENKYICAIDFHC